MDLARMSIQFLDLAASDNTYRTALFSMGSGIRASTRRLNDMPPDADPAWIEAVVDEECELMESLLGAAFVVCQAQITSVVSRALRVRESALRQPGGRFQAFNNAKGIRDLGDLAPPPATVTKIELLWELANYFKHREQWQTVDWAKSPKKAKATVAVIQQAGLTSGSTGNLRTGAEFLGNPIDYSHVETFADIIDSWAREVVDAVKVELGVV